MKSKMDNKYYTPSIEEFHVGFEYEISCLTVLQTLDDFGFSKSNYSDIDTYMKWYNEGCWKKKIFNLEDILFDLEKGNIRVKYLDEEDIESFGFSDSKNLKYEHLNRFLFWRFKTYSLKANNVYYYISLCDKNKVIIEIWNDDNSYPYKLMQIFNGTIKNKSELKMVLQQLNIIKNE